MIMRIAVDCYIPQLDLNNVISMESIKYSTFKANWHRSTNTVKIFQKTENFVSSIFKDNP